MIRAAVVGSTGYTGRELIRALLKHPHAVLSHCTSESSPNRAISSIEPAFYGQREIKTEKCDVARISKDTDLVFLCLPHGQSAKVAKSFLDRKVRVIDLSADFRLKSGELYRSWYKIKHPFPNLLKRAVYGLPEVYREAIGGADLIANPGCYATATLLAALPLVAEGRVADRSIIADAKSGVSGAGKKMDARYLFCEANENFLAYAVTGHRHTPEIEQELTAGSVSKRPIKITFVPHLLPINRGILVTLYAQLKSKMSAGSLWSLYEKFYRNEPFVKVLPQGSFPEVQSVQNTNFCQIGVSLDQKTQRAIAVSAIDNLGKGASTQAIQNMNIMFGLDEKEGLI